MRLTRFERFIAEVHPDPDSLTCLTVEEALPQLSTLADEYLMKIGKSHCASCGREFSESDIKLKESRPESICVACFTSNA